MFILDMYHTKHFRDTVMTVLPQRRFNSYDGVTTDLLGTQGQWQIGDFMVHFAGYSKAEKLNMVQKYMKLVLPFDNTSTS